MKSFSSKPTLFSLVFFSSGCSMGHWSTWSLGNASSDYEVVAFFIKMVETDVEDSNYAASPVFYRFENPEDETIFESHFESNECLYDGCGPDYYALRPDEPYSLTVWLKNAYVEGDLWNAEEVWTPNEIEDLIYQREFFITGGQDYLEIVLDSQ